MNLIFVFLFLSLISCKEGHQKAEMVAPEVHKQTEHDEHQETDEHGHDEHLTINASILTYMNVQSSVLRGPSPWKVPIGTSVSAGRETFVYHQEEKGSFSRIPVAVVRTEQKHEWLQSKALKPQDDIVTEGAKFLRVMELDAAAGEEAGHAH